MEDVAKLIVGAWRLVHSVIIKADGKKEYPLGEDALGYICYSDTGVMAVQQSRKTRGEVKDPGQLKHDYLGADLVLDTVGGPLFEPCLESLGQRGRQVAIASMGDPRVTFNLVNFYHKEARLLTCANCWSRVLRSSL
jgi:NADPH:quinone reductase-like Zn-dependent oxidoreductase